MDVLSLYKSLNLPTQVPSILTKDLFRRNSAHYDFVKIDTDSIDCSIVNQLLHAMELNLVSFSAVSFEIWTGEECEDMNLGYIIFALQRNSYKVYLAPATAVHHSGTYDASKISGMIIRSHCTRDNTTCLYELAELNITMWVGMSKPWRMEQQLYASKELPGLVQIWRARAL